MTAVRQQTYQPPDARSAAVEVFGFDRLRQLNDGGTQRADFHVLALIDGGHGRVTVDFESRPLAPRDAVWITPGAVHRWDDFADLTGTLVLFVPTAPVTEATKRLAATPDLASTWAVSADAWPYVDAARTHLVFEDGARTADPALALPQILLSALIARLDPPRTVQMTSGGTFDAFQAAVESHFREHHDAGFYARALGYAPRTLTRAVQRATGGSAKAYVVARIVLESKRLLVHDALPAAQVAAELGFPDASAFSLFFRTATGTPPATWRAATEARGRPPSRSSDS
ncbi:AraC family transcriptional regulator [Curtobacterium sp. ISL-83]|uniref:helix-turn-helix domain-containing protein n=1 Tax=Curtobacterium sp. ISL-83 TaxID=2819145 RepID=UPI001BE5EC57|nr:helix-turn-helix domain-containing protein [Curtobacterium sp. ISL-83]MBT2501114.1 helix-turn-helix domain-containing protein [Curtobacterium sp. ISL-83]